MSNTIWQPKLHKSDELPIYQAIADALERDVSDGVLRDGTRLPTHRELALKLGVTPLTITRAYKEASRRGLIDSTVGRGTFVRTLAQMPADSSQRGEMLDLSKNIIEGSAHLVIDPRIANDVRPMVQDSTYHPTEGTLRHRLAASAWMRRSNVKVDPDHVVITPGAQQAIVAVLAAVCRPGDVLLAEELTYPRLGAIAALLHLELEAVQLDEHGALPQSLERAARRSGAKAFYVIPNFQNPTGSVMPEKRRREIAQVAKRHNLLLLEDDVYGFLLDETPTAISSLLPDLSCHITSVSKSLTPSLRLGFAALPASLVEKVTATFGAMTAFTSTVAAEVFTQLVENGSVDATLQAKRKLVRSNRRAAERALGDHSFRGAEGSPHIWLQLPKSVDVRELADRARNRGISIAPASAFAVDRTAAPNAARISIASTTDAKQLESALRTVATLADDARFSTATVV